MRGIRLIHVMEHDRQPAQGIGLGHPVVAGPQQIDGVLIDPASLDRIQADPGQMAEQTQSQPMPVIVVKPREQLTCPGEQFACPDIIAEEQ